MELKEFIVKTLEQTTTHLEAGVVDFDIAVVPDDTGIMVPFDPGENRSLSRVRFSVKIKEK